MDIRPILLLVHKMLGHSILVFAGAGVLASLDFNGSVTAGSILIAGVLAAMAFAYTLRSKIADVWRTEAEGEKAAKERLQEELADEKRQRFEDAKHQQELRHNLKDELAGLAAQVKVMEARTDLTSALETIRDMNERTVAAVAETVTAINDSIVVVLERGAHASVERDTQTHHLLEEIRDKLPDSPIPVVNVDDVESHRAQPL